MYISWQVLNQSFKGRCTPTTDGGYMYGTGGPSGSFHVKWHNISATSPAVDRFHVTYEANSDKVYYLLTKGAIKYTGNRPRDGEVDKSVPERLVGKDYLYEYDDIAKAFLKSVNAISGKLRLELKEAVADDADVDKAVVDQKDRAKIIGELRAKYHNFTDTQFTKAGLQKLPVTQRFEWTPEMYEQAFAKLEGGTSTTPTSTTPDVPAPSTTSSSAVFSGSKVALPPPKGMAVNPGPVPTFSSWRSQNNGSSGSGANTGRRRW